MGERTDSRNLRAIKRGIVVAAFIGPLLTLINQWEAITGQVPIVIWKVVLTFIVPFCVSYISSRMAHRES